MFVKKTGMAVPCVFHLVTGWKCPGCGVTRMCVALLQLDFEGAFSSHPMLFAQMPFLGVIAVRNVYVYIRDGFCRPTKLETIVIYICIVLLIIYAIVRNLALRF